MSDLSHPADPGFRVILAHMQAKMAAVRLGRMLPDWPPVIKDEHDKLVAALRAAESSMWDVFCAPDETPNPGKDATADVSVESEQAVESRTVAGVDGVDTSAEPVDSSAAIPAEQGTRRCYDAMDDL